MLTPAVLYQPQTPTASAFRVMERDVAILEALHRYRMLTRRQVEQLFFTRTSDEGSPTRAYKRLRSLFLHGFVECIERPFAPFVFRLAKRGAKLLAERAGVSPADFHYWGKGDDRDRHPTNVTHYFLEHALALSHFRIAIEQAVAQAGWMIERWVDEVDMRAAQRGHATVFEPVTGAGNINLRVMPDGYFALRAPVGHRGHFFVEVDRGSETVSKAWKRKALAYKELFASGTFHETFRVGDRAVRFRVLVTTPSLPRAHNIQAVVAKHGKQELSDLFLFTPFQDVVAHDPLTAPIWRRGGTTVAQALL